MPLHTTQSRLRSAAVRILPLLAAALLQPGAMPPAQAASPLLESVKSNPQLAKSLCSDLRNLKSQGISSTSKQAVAMVAQRQGLNSTDAEILTTYVVGLHCPDVN